MVRRKGRYLASAIALAVVLLVCILSTCWVIPATTGQFCIDIASGHVPRQADARFTRQVFASIRAGDYSWLTAVSDKDALQDAKTIDLPLTGDYLLVSGDDIAGYYDRTYRFDDGTCIHLSFFGSWSCPDFVVTDREIIERLSLASIYRLTAQEDLDFCERAYLQTIRRQPPH